MGITGLVKEIVTEVKMVERGIVGMLEERRSDFLIRSIRSKVENLCRRPREGLNPDWESGTFQSEEERVRMWFSFVGNPDGSGSLFRVVVADDRNPQIQNESEGNCFSYDISWDDQEMLCLDYAAIDTERSISLGIRGVDDHCQFIESCLGMDPSKFDWAADLYHQLLHNVTVASGLTRRKKQG